MVFIKRLLNSAVILLLFNILILKSKYGFSAAVFIISIAILILLFLLFNINPGKYKAASKRLKIMAGGSDLLKISIVVFLAEILIYLYLYIFSKTSVSPGVAIVNTVVGIIVLLILMWNGIIRILSTSTQLGFFMRIMLIIVWWVPLVNIFVILKCCSVVNREYKYEMAKIELNNVRKEKEVCKTRYPILMVHGIFWRDWQFFNYWGRISSELIKNGAVVYYGNQQSATEMEVCAKELKEQILSIVEKEKCQKVNIIAHSKGGLDARYAISCLGMDEYVGSLTTICTPHQGCYFVDRLLNKIPDKTVLAIAKRYNSFYKKLGDKEPDFYSGIYDLTVKKCSEFNEKVTDRESVLYQSVASEMKSFFSASFPLNIGYVAIRRSEGENDGFVTIESSKWGNFLGCYTPKNGRGISHGDMIDLKRENIPNFDVCECYVEIVKGLRAKNL